MFSHRGEIIALVLFVVSAGEMLELRSCPGSPIPLPVVGTQDFGVFEVSRDIGDPCCLYGCSRVVS